MRPVASGALDCAQFMEHLACASSIGSGVLIRINGGKAAVSCMCKQSILAETCRFTPGKSQ